MAVDLPKRIRGSAALAGLAVAGFYVALTGGHAFLYDDERLILDEVVARSPVELAKVFVEPYYGTLPYYRPLARLTYLTQKAIWGARPLPYLALNALLAGLLVVAAYALLRRPRFAIGRGPALAAAAAFALVPAASSCVLPIAGRDTLIPTLLIVGSLALWIRDTGPSRAASRVLIAAALLSKEVGVAAPLLAILADATAEVPPRGARAWLSRHLPSAAVVAGYVVVRHVVLGDGARAEFAGSWSLPIATLGFGAQVLLAPFLDLVYEPALRTWLSLPRLALALAALTALFWAARRGERRDGPRNADFWLGCFVALQLPAANLFRQETLFDERYAFPAVIAPLALAATYGSRPTARRVTRALRVAAVVVGLAACVGIDARRSVTFADGRSFYGAWTRSSPGSAAAWNGLGVALLDAGRRDAGEAALRRALACDPRHPQASGNLGVALLDRGEVNEASVLLEAAVAESPNDATARFNLANARDRAGRQADAEALYRDAIRLRPHYARAWNNLGALLVREGRDEEALEAFERAARSDPEHAKARLNRGVILARRGRLGDAIAAYREAIALAPDDADARFDLAAALLASGDAAAAVGEADEALRIRPGWMEARELRARAAGGP